ncbi:MAG: PrsW family intramembrane metalloprotease [Anaerolineales bacterium]|nr:PrsW family intramembrane metalloprotease [Anaerolineales bacterium]
MGFITSLLFGFVPMLVFSGILYWLDRYEKEPKLVLGVVFTWGAIVAAGAAFLINTILGMGVYSITGSDIFTELTTGSLVAPIIEETLKGLAVLLVYLIFRSEFDSLLDGSVFAGIAALGFAATENSYYIYNYGFLEGGYRDLFQLVFIRVILVGWQHPFYTAFIGIGLALARF